MLAQEGSPVQYRLAATGSRSLLKMVTGPILASHMKKLPGAVRGYRRLAFCFLLAGFALAFPAAAMSFSAYNQLASGPQQVRLLPGQREFVFTIYGTPDDLEQLKQLLNAMKEKHLGNGFDPGPAARSASKPLFDYLATEGWPVIAYPGCADMQIKGGRCVLTAQDRAALAALDQKDMFNAVQLGEWGYYFHNLAPNERWWHDVYGPDFDAMKHLMKPPGLAGYDHRPTTRQECYDVLKGKYSANPESP